MSLFDKGIGIFDYSCEALDNPVPPDVLLELCKNQKVDIKDIFISDITEKYIEFIQSLDEMDYENIANFLEFASKLLEYKSNALLPKPEFTEDAPEISADDLFLMRVQEYAILKDASEKLRESEVLNRFYREPIFGENDYNLIIKNFSVDKMVNAFSMLMEKIEYEEDKTVPKTIIKERFTVAEKILQLVEEVRAYKYLSFFNLIDANYSKVEVINTFLALLEMLKQQIITVEQSEIGGDITIRYSSLTDNFGNNNTEELLKDVEEYN